MRHSINLKKIACTAFAVGLLGAGAWGCGDDTADDDTPAAGTNAAGAGGTSGGAGGSSGGSGGSGGAAAMPIPCGTPAMDCAPIMTAAGTTLMPCCDASMGNACGAITGMMGTTPICTARKQMGTVSDECTDAVSVLTMPVEGCCRPDGMCGLLSNTLEMSCVERSKYPLGFLGGTPPPTMPLPSETCGGDADGGI
jgi:hypothetical protein